MKIKRKRNNFSVPLFSTSDIAFLLLIFIMLVALINYRKTVDIKFATAQTVKKVNVDKNLEIWVDISGGLYLSGNPSTLPLIEREITDAYREFPETRVHVIADRDTPFENVQQVLGILQLLQHRLVSFVVKNE